MVTTLAAGLCGLLLVLAGSQLLLAAAFVRKLSRRDPAPTPGRPRGRALVVLPLRGGDPFLSNCVEALLHQDYPTFDIRIVIDGRGDPAWSIVESVLSRHKAMNVRVEALESRRPTCSLKCSSVLQAVADLDSAYDFVAQLDADTIPHEAWLSELAAALEDDSVGAATGNRWYFPGKVSWGSLVRYVWNAAAVVQMYCYGIAWGGTLAVKAELLRTAGLRDRWSRAFCEDTMISSALRPLGLRVAFVPSLMMVNRESCTLRGYEGWVRRQLLTARLYHPAWPAVAGHGIATSLALALSLIVLVHGLAEGDWSAARACLGGLVAYESSMLVALFAMERGVRRIVRARGEPTHWLTPSALLKCCAAVPFTQVLYARSLLAAVFLRTVVWRGVRYEVNGLWHIRMTSDAVSEGTARTRESCESL